MERNPKTAMLILFAFGSLVIGIAVLAWVLLAKQETAAAPVATLSPEFEATLSASTKITAPRVTLADAKNAFDATSAVFVDVRSLAGYEKSHVSGAISIPLAEIGRRYSELDPKAWIIAYCACPDEADSTRATQMLLSLGFEKVTTLKGGFGGWIEARYPRQ